MSVRHSVCRGVCVIALLCVGALPASAQIFSWRDAAGHLMLSNTPPGEDARSVVAYAVAAAEEDAGAKSGDARTEAYHDLIAEHAKRNGVRPSLVRAVIQVESAFNPSAVSPKGAIGLMQLMPATAREFGVHNAFNPSENVRAGVAYLRRLLDRYDNDETLALAAYNAGPGAVDHYGQSIPPYRETRDYVLKVNGIAGQAPAVAVPSSIQIYKRVEIIDGREVIKYTDQKPDADR
jgi:soluble lytic murein transglycosylase-like protein